MGQSMNVYISNSRCFDEPINAVVLDFNASNDKTDISSGLLEQKSGEDRESTTAAKQQKVGIT